MKTFAVPLLAIALAAAACGTTDTASLQGASETSTEPKLTTPTVPVRSSLPNFVGMGLQSAQDEAQATGFKYLDSHDSSGRGRLQVLDRNWKVCFQSPPANSKAEFDATVDFGVVKLEETCPVNDGNESVVRSDHRMPTLIGLSLQVARDALPGNSSISAKDVSGQGRSIWVESNWQVCAQDPPSGTPLAGQPVYLEVVKFDEVCL